MIKFTKEMKREIEIFLFLPYHDMTIYYIYLRYREYIYDIYKIHYKVSLKKVLAFETYYKRNLVQRNFLLIYVANSIIGFLK